MVNKDEYIIEEPSPEVTLITLQLVLVFFFSHFAEISFPVSLSAENGTFSFGDQ